MSKKPKRVRSNYYAHFEQMARDYESVFRAIFLYNGYSMPNLDSLIHTIKESRKTLFILCGFPYAGKSYVSRQLQQQTDIQAVSIDDIFKANGFDWDTNKLPNKEEWKKISDESYQMSKATLGEGKSVLYDSTNQTVDSRNKLREVAPSMGADVCVIYIQTPVETVWKRWEENQKNPTRSVVSRELIQMTLDMFEEPTESENVIIVSN